MLTTALALCQRRPGEDGRINTSQTNHSMPFKNLENKIFKKIKTGSIKFYSPTKKNIG